MLVLSGGRGGRRGARRVRFFLLRALLLVVFVLDDFIFVDSGECVGVVRVLGATRWAEVRVGLFDSVPTPHAQPVPARTREEVLVRQVHGLAAEGAHGIVAVVRIVKRVRHDGSGAAAAPDAAAGATTTTADPSNALRPRRLLLKCKK